VCTPEKKKLLLIWHSGGRQNFLISLKRTNKTNDSLLSLQQPPPLDEGLSLSLLSEESVSDPNKIPISLFSVYKRIQNTFAFSLSLRNVLKRQIFFYNLYMWNKLLSLSAFPCWLRRVFLVAHICSLSLLLLAHADGKAILPQKIHQCCSARIASSMPAGVNT
jgi:hypothetical protein